MAGLIEFENGGQRLSGKAPAAFSLLELLVVMAIVAVVAGLLLPALARSKGKAQQMRCLSNLHQQGLALQTFLGEYNCYPAWLAATNSDLPGRWWQLQLERGGFGVANPAVDFYRLGVWCCPAALDRKEQVSQNPFYGYNVFGLLSVGNLTNNLGLGGTLGTTGTPKPVRDSEVAAPAAMMAIGDSDAFAFMRVEDYDFYHRDFRHGNRVSVVFCDGHVELPTLQLLFDDTCDEALTRWNRDHQPHRDRL